MVHKEMAVMKPLPSIYYPDFIAANQEDRADNVLPGSKATGLTSSRSEQISGMTPILVPPLMHASNTDLFDRNFKAQNRP